MGIKDPINKTWWKNSKDLSNGAPNIKLWNHTKKTHFSGFCRKFPQAMHEVENFFCQFPNPWTLRVSGMGGYTSKCEKKSKSLHPIEQAMYNQIGEVLLTVPRTSPFKIFYVCSTNKYSRFSKPSVHCTVHIAHGKISVWAIIGC